MDKATKDKLQLVFSQTDTNHSGFVEQDELLNLFSKMNVTLDDKSFHNVVAKFDKNKDEKFSQAEFEEMLVYVLGERNKAVAAGAGAAKPAAPPAKQPAVAVLKPAGGAVKPAAFGGKPAPVPAKAAAGAKQAASAPSPASSSSVGVEISSEKTVKAPTKLTALDSIKARFHKISGNLKEKTATSDHDLSTGQFEDPAFPPSDEWLPKVQRGKNIQWKRPAEIIENPQLFVDGTAEGDVKQGHIGNCWFVGALAVVAASGNALVEHLFIRSNFAEGRHHIRFFKDFDWVVVEIDDRLPVLPDGRLLFAKCPDKHEFWVPFVEKAYAKLHKGYYNIESGTITDGLRDLTGEGVEMLDIRNIPNKDDIWPILVHNIKESFLMGCAMELPGVQPEKVTAEGLLTNHAYSIIDCQEFKGQKLLQVRNPWGQGEWKGAWADASKEWTPDFKKHFNYVEENDGTFYMNWADFSSRFNVVHVLRLLTDEVGEVWTKSVFVNEWKGPSAGGCTNNPGWYKNPQYSVSTQHKNNRVFVCLSQPDQRYHGNHETINYQPIGALVLTDKETRYKKTTLKKDEVVYAPSYAPRRDVSFEFTANPGAAYVIIPTTFEARVELPFEIAIYTQKAAKVTERPEEMPVKKAESSWSGQSAGGCPNFPTWHFNPQFNVTTEKTAKFIISLEQETKNHKNSEAEPIGFFVFTAASRGERIINYNKQAPVYNSPSFSPTPVVSGEIQLEAGHIYVFVPCTFEAHKEKAFTLSIGSVEDADLLRGVAIVPI